MMALTVDHCDATEDAQKQKQQQQPLLVCGQFRAGQRFTNNQQSSAQSNQSEIERQFSWNEHCRRSPTGSYPKCESARVDTTARRASTWKKSTMTLDSNSK